MKIKQKLKRADVKKKIHPIKCPNCGWRLFDGDEQSTASPQVEKDLEDTGNHNFMKCPRCKQSVSF